MSPIAKWLVSVSVTEDCHFPDPQLLMYKIGIANSYLQDYSRSKWSNYIKFPMKSRGNSECIVELIKLMSLVFSRMFTTTLPPRDQISKITGWPVPLMHSLSSSLFISRDRWDILTILVSPPTWGFLTQVESMHANISLFKKLMNSTSYLE